MKKMICTILILVFFSAAVSSFADEWSDAVDRAYSWLGRANFVAGACRPGEFDCSGFVSYCVTGTYERIGTIYTFLGYPRVSNPQPGDICVSENDCGIYIGGGQMIHMSPWGVGVIISPVQRDMVYTSYYHHSDAGADPQIPSTGDSNDPLLWAVILMISTGLAVTALKLKRREQ